MANINYKCLSCNITLIFSTKNLQNKERIINGITYFEYIDLDKFNNKYNILTLILIKDSVFCHNCKTEVGIIHNFKLYLLISRLHSNEALKNENKNREITLVSLNHIYTFNKQVEVVNDLALFSILSDQQKTSKIDIIEKLNKASISVNSIKINN